MNLDQRIQAFVTLGKKIENILAISSETQDGLTEGESLLLQSKRYAGYKNGWFTPVMVDQALNGLVFMLSEEQLVDWLSSYVNKISKTETGKEVGIIMAGNIPAVGFHDLLCVLLSGHKAIVKLSSDDAVIIPALIKVLIEINVDFQNLIEIQERPRNQYDAIIATGSNNTARYFEQYFGKFPNLIRKSRTSVAVLTGHETEFDFEGLAKDMFTYFGLGCRNVSKLLVLGKLDVEAVMGGLSLYTSNLDLSKYQNNIDYYKSIYLINRVPFFDGGLFFLKQDDLLHSPVSVTFYQEFETLDDIQLYIENNREEIQCVVGNIPNALPFGAAQTPGVADYADGVDTMEFLMKITN